MDHLGYHHPIVATAQGALVFPDQEVLDQLAAKLNQTELSSSELESLLKKEVSELNAARLDYHPYEHIVHIAVVHRVGG